jgi:hypothetical protein
MQIITKGYLWLSIFLFVIGTILGKEIFLLIVPEHIIITAKKSDLVAYIIFFGCGIPLAILNILESKYIWAKIFKRKKLDILGIRSGFLFGVLSFLLI